ncbi:hypothetical protein E4U41_003066, partial [Claviceps citrina]
MNGQRPRLRNGTDLQLQSAFQDGNWAVAMRLAQQRARTFNDPYFEIVKLCAESQLDDAQSKFVAVAAIDKFVKDGTVVKDADAIDLLEWFTVELIPEHAFSDTIGPLRVRAVKAQPKDKVAATRCLQSCLLHWDLNSAQQIAAIMDRSFPQDRHFMFWNIVITHLLATSSQAPPDKKKLYAMLAQKQIERAALLTEQAHASHADDGTTPARGIRTEQEVLLLYDIVETHGTAEDWNKLVGSPVFSPVAQFRLGRKELFQRVASKYKRSQQWALLYDLCHECLSDAGKEGELTLLACDWSVWRQFLEAAAYMKSSDARAVAKLQDLLIRVAKTQSLKPIYKRNVLLAKVAAAFVLEARDQDDVDDDRPSSSRLQELLLYVDEQKTSIACFDDIKEYVEKLDAGGLKHMAYTHVPELAKSAKDPVSSARIRLLSLKLQYLATTCPVLRIQVAGRVPACRCVVCGSGFESESCHLCLSSISSAALEAYRSAAEELKDHAAVQNNELLPELALVVALCDVQMAFCGRPGYVASEPKPELLVRALVMLEHQVLLSPKHSQVCLLLVQLHLLVGSAHRCREIWQRLGVKRTIVDSLAPILYDRLSTVGPAMLDPSDDEGWDLVETLRGHFANSLAMPMPRRLLDAFEAGSYGSIIDMPRYIENLRFGCTRAMSLVEEARADRLLGEACGEFLNDGRFYEVRDEVDLRDAVDYGSFPAWESSASTPLHERLRLGPGLSNTRAHLSLLGEAFQDVVAYKPPAAYKTSASVTGVMDCTFVLETMSQLGNSMSQFLGDAPTRCTPSETLYYETVHLLATLVPLCVSIDRSAPPPSALGLMADAIQASMASQLDALPDPADSSSSSSSSTERLLSTLCSLHQIAMLHDTATATKLTTAWILAFSERERERDRGGGGSLPRSVVTQLKALQTCADEALRHGRRL